MTGGDDQPRVLQVFDVACARDRALHVGWPPLMDWIREHGADPNRVRRVEVLLIDCPIVRFHETVRDDAGQLVVYRDDTGHMCIRETTRDVICRRPAPVREVSTG